MSGENERILSSAKRHPSQTPRRNPFAAVFPSAGHVPADHHRRLAFRRSGDSVLIGFELTNDD
jgi:hypothetical protein